jgi:hypothetical protein
MKKYLVLFLGMFFVLGITTMSWAGAALTDKDKKMTFGVKAQIWAQMLEDAATSGKDNAIDFDIRQLRLYGGGQIIPLIKFGFNLDAEKGFRDGSRTVRSVDTNITDANLTFDFAPEAKVLVGLYRTPFTRMALTDSYTAYLFPHSPEIAGGGYVGSLGNFRNAGITLWGDAMGGKIKYGAGIFEGDLAPGGGLVPSDDSPFYSVRFAVSPLEPQKGYVYTQQWVDRAKKPVLTVGAGYLAAKYNAGTAAAPSNKTYSAWTADLYTEIPVGGGAIGAEGAYMEYDRDVAGGKTKGWYGQVGYLIGGLNLQPALGYEKSERTGSSKEDFTIWKLGLNYYFAGHDAKINLEYLDKEYEVPVGTGKRNSDFADLTLALQIQF